MYVFPAWFALISACFVYFEFRKQYRLYVTKGRAKVLGVVEIVNENFGKSTDGSHDRLIPRTEALPLYTIVEFNDKVKPEGFQMLLLGVALGEHTWSTQHPGPLLPRCKCFAASDRI